MLNTEKFRNESISKIGIQTSDLPLPSLLRFGFSMILPPMTESKEISPTNNSWYNIFGFTRLTGSFLALQNYLSTCSVNQEVKELMSCCRLNKKQYWMLIFILKGNQIAFISRTFTMTCIYTRNNLTYIQISLIYIIDI